MKKSKTCARSKVGIAWSALVVLVMGHSSQAQAQSTLTLSGNVSITTCFVKVALGSGASGGGVGSSTPTFAIPAVQNSAPTTSAIRGASLNSVTKFTVGLASSAGGSGTCTVGSNWNTAFALASPDTSISGRQLIPVTGGATGIGLELSSWSADGATLKQAISSYPAAATGVSFSGANNTSSQTGLDAVATTASQTFGVTVIKTAANGAAIGSGALSANLTLSYAVF